MENEDVTSRLRGAMADRAVKSGAALARLTGIPESTARAYVNGTRKPPLDVCIIIASKLGVPGAWLYYGNDIPGTSVEGNIDPMLREIFDQQDLIISLSEAAFAVILKSNSTAMKIAQAIRDVVVAQPSAEEGVSAEGVARILVRRKVQEILSRAVEAHVPRSRQK